MDNSKTIDQKIKKFIEVESEDSILTHLKHVFLLSGAGKIHGEIIRNKTKVWVAWDWRIIGAFYPIITITINENENKISIKSRMNPVGLLIAVIINICISCTSLFLFLLRDDASSNSFLARFLVFLFFITGWNIPIYLSYKSTKNALIAELKEVLKQ